MLNTLLHLHLATVHLDSCGGVDDAVPIEQRGEHFGKGYRLLLKPFKIIPRWSPQAEVLIQTAIAQCKEHRQMRLEAETATKQPRTSDVLNLYSRCFSVMMLYLFAN